jgi:hypothetical protein
VNLVTTPTKYAMLGHVDDMKNLAYINSIICDDGNHE